jgi:hypothetical protein
MLSNAHSAKRVSINVVAFVASIIFTTNLCPVLANASRIELLNDCANGISQGQPNATTAQGYTFSCQPAGNYFGSTEALQSVDVIAGASDFLHPVRLDPAQLDPVQLDIVATDLSASPLLSGVSVTESSGAVSDADQSDSPDRVPEPLSLTLICIGLVAGLGIHLHKTISRNIPSAPAPQGPAS